MIFLLPNQVSNNERTKSVIDMCFRTTNNSDKNTNKSYFVKLAVWLLDTYWIYSLINNMAIVYIRAFMVLKPKPKTAVLRRNQTETEPKMES